MQIIKSSNNNLVKMVRQLKLRKNRQTKGKFIIEGLHLVEEAIKWSNTLEQLLVSEEFMEKTAKTANLQLLKLAKDKKIQVVAVADDLFNQLSDTETPQGIIGVARQEVNTLAVDQVGKNLDYALILNNIQDPGNLGTLIRTADAAGFSQIFLTKGTVDPYNPKVLRAAMGSHFHLTIFFIDSDDELIAELKKQRVAVVIAHVHEAESLFAVKIGLPLVLVLGNEAKGPDQRWLQAADITVKIPLFGKAESLNVSMAGAIVMYEIIRQNKFDH